jgi:hypothetical protein
MRSTCAVLTSTALVVTLSASCSSDDGSRRSDDGGHGVPAASRSDEDGSSSGPGAGTGTMGTATPAPEADPPDAPDTGAGVEVLPPPEEGAELPLPALSDRGPLVGQPLPRTASAAGSYVEGYPVAALPALPQGRISTSSVSSQAPRVQVALSAVTTRSRSAVLRFYRVRLSRLGFAERPVAAVGGAQAAGFRRGRDSVVVTVAGPGREGTPYSVVGTLHAGR